MVYNFFDRKTESGTASKFRANINKVPAQELHKAVIKRFKRRTSMRGLKIILWL